MPGHGGGADEEPVLVVGGQLLPGEYKIKVSKSKLCNSHLVLVFTRSTHSGTFILPDLHECQLIKSITSRSKCEKSRSRSKKRIGVGAPSEEVVLGI